MKEELLKMFHKLPMAAEDIGLYMNYIKTKNIANANEDIKFRFGREKIDQVYEYSYNPIQF